MRVERFVAPILFFCAIALAAQSGAASDPNDACADADQAVAASQWQKARSLYATCLASSPPRFETLSNQGMVLTQLGLMPEAIESYQKALALSPGNTKVEFNLAVAFVKAGNFNAAVEQLLALRKVEPDEVRIPELLAFSYYHLGRYSLAAREAERVNKSHPENAGNALILGSAYTRLGLYDKALPLITMALKSAGSAEGHLIMGETLLGLRLYRPAIEELTQAATLQPDLQGLHSALGVGNVGLGNPDAALAEFQKALDADPNDYQANYYMGRLKRLAGDIIAARKFLERADQLRPGTAEVVFEFAAIEMTAQDYSKAEPLLTRVVRQEPDHREAHFLLAKIYLKQGRREAAQRERETFERLTKAEQDKASKEDATVGSAKETPDSATKN